MKLFTLKADGKSEFSYQLNKRNVETSQLKLNYHTLDL